MKRLIAILLLMGLVLSGCQQITEGRVIDKKYYPAYTWIQWIPDSNGRATGFTQITHYEPASWYVVVEGQNDKGEIVQATYKVSLEEYESIQIGDWYSVESKDN